MCPCGAKLDKLLMTTPPHPPLPPPLLSPTSSPSPLPSTDVRGLGLSFCKDINILKCSRYMRKRNGIIVKRITPEMTIHFKVLCPLMTDSIRYAE